MFDAVIANHMLYHLNDVPGILAGIHRIIKPDGWFFATTIGKNHLVEITELISRFDSALEVWGYVAGPFTLENGENRLKQNFSSVRSLRYEDALIVTNPDPLIDFILSGWFDLPDNRLVNFKQFIKNEINHHPDGIHISKDSGIFIARL
jgi:SAM-dependent methyltransferase